MNSNIYRTALAAMRKKAANEYEQDAGIGSAKDNGSSHHPLYNNGDKPLPGSYAARLLEAAPHLSDNNHNTDPRTALWLATHYNSPITLDELTRARELQAGELAAQHAPDGSAPWKQWRDYYTKAGEGNYDTYVRTGRPNKPFVPKPGEFPVFDAAPKEEQEQALKNSPGVVRNDRRGNGNIVS
jgi:hypothetical protein